MKRFLFLMVITAGPVAADPRDDVLTFINIEREIAGCPALTVNRTLEAVALAHSEAMAEEDFFSHVDRDRRRPADRVTAAGYTWLMAGENISAGYVDPEATVIGWMNSPRHRANILTCAYTETGIGHAYNPDDGGEVKYGHYWTQVFGRPMPKDR
ncbi:SCP-like extracellular family protein [Asticcacaulis biprosthecium C19]|uniref:SCP-like extracellular family protein n=1 Tax=Asticcacaulis biprosthecium C19 TaxID=715226 RepID=F4QRU6_9CAUL|nr:CAP domain-containing protein [Asticcacaulis biprosthecium]EGF89466.1 SCP-like extracellular family protein [Asticcacaulis biprosthecium C19]